VRTGNLVALLLTLWLLVVLLLVWVLGIRA
jgi:hypothetical protein